MVEGTESGIASFAREANRIGKTLKIKKTQSLKQGIIDRKYDKFGVVNTREGSESMDNTCLLQHLTDLGIAGKYKFIIGVEEHV